MLQKYTLPFYKRTLNISRAGSLQESGKNWNQSIQCQGKMHSDVISTSYFLQEGAKGSLREMSDSKSQKGNLKKSLLL